MILSIALAACLFPKIINQTNEQFGTNAHDRPAFNKARKTCQVRYKGCLKVFIKKDIQNYHAICSKEYYK